MSAEPVSGSFRDPGGFLFRRENVLYRQVNISYRSHYDRLLSCGLYETLAARGLMVAHEEVDREPAAPELAYRVLKPREVPFVSYPYEWCFGQLKGAALTTLAIQKIALERGMSLKDASAYNIQFEGSRPVLIDTLSFEPYEEGRPWVAYGQFCRHFLAPLALMSYRDVRLAKLLRASIDGIELDLASSLLPRRTWLKPSLLLHLHLHAASGKRFGSRQVKVRGRGMGRTALLGLIDSLESAVRKLAWKPGGTEWAGYYGETNYTGEAMAHKAEIVSDMLARAAPALVWDLGANTGMFSRIAARKGAFTVAFDLDPSAVETNWRTCLETDEEVLLPLVLDLTNPSPAVGWANEERESIRGRGPADLIMALALVHHLAVSNNVPLERIAAFLAELGSWLIIEFVPKSDSQVRRLLATREDIFARYTRLDFEKDFGRSFEIESVVGVKGSERAIYLMRSRGR